MFSVEQLVANCLFSQFVETRSYYVGTEAEGLSAYYHENPLKSLNAFRWVGREHQPLWFVADPIFKTRVNEHLADFHPGWGDHHALVSLYWAYVYMRETVAYETLDGELVFFLPQAVRDCYPGDGNPLPVGLSSMGELYGNAYFTWNAIAIFVMWLIEDQDSPSDGSKEVRDVCSDLLARAISLRDLATAQRLAISLES